MQLAVDGAPKSLAPASRSILNFSFFNNHYSFIHSFKPSVFVRKSAVDLTILEARILGRSRLLGLGLKLAGTLSDFS
jgi:hypothetical protein